MTETGVTEVGLILALKRVREAKKIAKEEVDRLSKNEMQAEAELLQYLSDRGATKTATYDGVGSATAVKPRLFASCTAEMFDQLKQHLQAVGRTDLLKETVASSTLSSYIEELLMSGGTVPECVTYYLKPQIKLNGAKL